MLRFSAHWRFSLPPALLSELISFDIKKVRLCAAAEPQWDDSELTAAPSSIPAPSPSGGKPHSSSGNLHRYRNIWQTLSACFGWFSVNLDAQKRKKERKKERKFKDELTKHDECECANHPASAHEVHDECRYQRLLFSASASSNLLSSKRVTQHCGKFRRQSPYWRPPQHTLSGDNDSCKQLMWSDL